MPRQQWFDAGWTMDDRIEFLGWVAGRPTPGSGSDQPCAVGLEMANLTFVWKSFTKEMKFLWEKLRSFLLEEQQSSLLWLACLKLHSPKPTTFGKGRRKSYPSHIFLLVCLISLFLWAPFLSFLLGYIFKILFIIYNMIFCYGLHRILKSHQHVPERFKLSCSS